MEGNERKIQKTNVGAYALRTYPQNGITLIALIITIIVMLILVGVTINVVLNGGLFTQAQTAAEETQIEADREQLLSAVVGAIGTDAKVDFSKLDSNLPSGWTGSNGTYTSPKGNVFTVDEKGNINYDGKDEVIDPSTLTDLEKYILGADGKGRAIWAEYDEEDNLIDGILNGDDLIFIQDPTNSNSTIYKDVKLAYYGEGTSDDELYLAIRYGRDVYKFKVELPEEGGMKSVKGSLKKVSSPEGNLGKYVTYEGITWIVLYDNAEKLELISADALGNVILKEGSFAEGKESYNNAIKTLTDECKNVTGITTGIRNVGGPAEDPKDLGTVTLADLKSEGFESQSDKETEIESLIEDIKQKDEKYLTDYNQMKTLGILVADNPIDYWWARRSIEVSSTEVLFGVTRTSDARLSNECLCELQSDSYATGGYGNRSGECVRPVVSLTPGILDGKSEGNTRDNPIKLD